MDGSNPNIARDWNFYMNQVGKANQVICFIDDIKDPSLTDEERKQWKAEAMCWRAFMWYNMSRLWGEIPIVKEVPPAITSENVDEVYPMYYPAREPLDEVFQRTFSRISNLPRSTLRIRNPADKFLLTKGFAYGMLAPRLRRTSGARLQSGGEVLRGGRETELRGSRIVTVTCGPTTRTTRFAIRRSRFSR